MNEKTEKLVAMLAKRGKKLTTAESCTGGMIASEITSVPGASHVRRRLYHLLRTA